MSSSTSPQHDRMLAQQRAHEPSMEEILASIRRIIADDDRSSEAARVEAARPAQVRVETPRVETARAEPLRVEPGFRAAAVREAAFRDAALAPAPAANAEPAAYAARVQRVEPFEALTARLGEPRAEPAVEVEPAIEAEPVIAYDTEAAAPSDGAALAPAPFAPAPAAPAPAAPMLSREADAAVAAQFGRLSDALMANNAQRLDDMARQMLRPLLKSWLDDNLPVLVERLVRAEIERVARGGR